MRATVIIPLLLCFIFAWVYFSTITPALNSISLNFKALQEESNNDGHTIHNDTVSSMFDEMTHVTYTDAIEPVELERQPFDIKTWKRGQVLDDKDRVLLGILYFNATSVFEYGLGESTRIAAAVGVPRYAGVDSDPEWVTMARKDSKMSHFRFSFADIGKTIDFGYPSDGTLAKIAYDYQIAPLVLEMEPFDFYLVDGRYRVACVCVSFLHALKWGGDRERVMVGIHDVNDPNRGYGVLDHIGDVLFHTKQLIVYKLKATTTEAELYYLWKFHRNTQTRR